MRHDGLLLLLAAIATAATTAALCGSWSFRPGLWEVTTSQELSPQTQATMQTRHIPAPGPQTRQFCWQPGNDTSQSLFDPAEQPPGVCHEKTLPDDEAGRDVVEDDCNLPRPDIFPPDETSPAPLPPVPTEARRHILKSGDGAGMVDALQVRAGPPGQRLVQSFRWLAAQCPAGMAH